MNTEERASVRRDLLEVYLQEIAQTPLLTPEEEIELAKRIKRGDKEARLRMIKANLRLVVKIAHDYEGLGLPLLDLISEGNIGLMKAVERFNPKKGAKLSTYAALWIKQSIRRALSNQSKTIRLPVHIVDKVSKLNRLQLQLTDELGREPTDDELADELDLTPAKVAHLRNMNTRPASLDAPIGDDDDNRFADIVPDPNAPTPYDVLQDKTMRKSIREHVKKLSPREAEIIILRYGLDGNKPMTLEEVGKRFKVTRERIRQIQDAALVKLRRMLQKEDQPMLFSRS